MFIGLVWTSTENNNLDYSILHRNAIKVFIIYSINGGGVRSCKKTFYSLKLH